MDLAVGELPHTARTEAFQQQETSPTAFWTKLGLVSIWLGKKTFTAERNKLAVVPVKRRLKNKPWLEVYSGAEARCEIRERPSARPVWSRSSTVSCIWPYPLADP